MSVKKHKHRGVISDTHTHTDTASYPIKKTRNYRMAELIQQVIATVLQKEVHDPRLNTVNITGVDLSPNYQSATVFFTLLDPSEKNIKEAESAFQKAKGFFRLQLSRETTLRYTPQLTFQYDRAIDQGERISKLLG